ncbi:MAG: hypothetical protein ACHQDE_09075, partial [Acidimicrobiia bacterium]
MVVLESPVLEEQLCFEEAVEAFQLEQLSAEVAVEGFDERILPGARSSSRTGTQTITAGLKPFSGGMVGGASRLSSTPRPGRN